MMKYLSSIIRLVILGVSLALVSCSSDEPSEEIGGKIRLYIDNELIIEDVSPKSKIIEFDHEPPFSNSFRINFFGEEEEYYSELRISLVDLERNIAYDGGGSLRAEGKISFCTGNVDNLWQGYNSKINLINEDGLYHGTYTADGACPFRPSNHTLRVEFENFEHETI